MSKLHLKMSNKLLLTLVIFGILFYGTWALVELVVRDWLASFADPVMLALLRDGVIKNLVWTLPALLLIRHFSAELAVGHREMWHWKKKDWLVFLPLLAALTVFVLAAALLDDHALNISPSFGWDTIIIVLFVGLTEELVFRGWLLNAAAKHADTELKKWLILLLNAVLFLVIHFPIWIKSGVFVSSFQGMGFLTIIVLSMLFGWSFLKTRNLLVPILLHSVYDLLVFLLV